MDVQANEGTKTELAQRLGVSVKRVTSAIERGVIGADCVGQNARGQRCIIDMDRAEDAFRAANVRAPRSDVAEASSRALPRLPEGFDPAQLEPGVMPPDGVDLNMARTIREWWGALRERARHEREEGEWVKREAVKRDVFAVFRMTRDAVLGVPDRVCDDLAAETDPHRVRERMCAEFTRILEDLAVGLRKLTDGAPVPA
jgi:hypothetical protein